MPEIQGTQGQYLQNRGILAAINSYFQHNRIGDVLVRRGKISADQLHNALALQESRSIPLGRILVSEGLVSFADLKFALWTQSSVRLAATFVALFAGGMSFSGRAAMASPDQDIPAGIMLAMADSVPATVGPTAALFGSTEKISYDLTAFSKWNEMFRRFDSHVKSSTHDLLVQKWKQDLSEIKGMPFSRMVVAVNDLMNKVKYIGDNRNWQKSDYWETPVEFLSYGGDCEDFAIAKYASLRALGVPDRAMRIAIVKDVQKGIPHAVLVVYAEDGPVILDNQIKAVTKASKISHYKPIFSINHTAWWIHMDQNYNSPTQIASAAR